MADCPGRQKEAWSCTSTSWCQRRWHPPEWAWWSSRQQPSLGPTSPPQPTSPLQASQTERYSSWPDMSQASAVAITLSFSSAYRIGCAMNLQRGHIRSRRMQESSGKLLLKLRIPAWLDEARGASVTVNGEAWAGCQAAAGHMAGSFCTVDRVFTAGAHSSCKDFALLP